MAFRDALRADAVLRDEYAALKRSLAARHTDVEAYTDGKDEFVESVLYCCGVPDVASGQCQSRDLLAILRTLEVETYQACIRGNSVRLGELLHPGFREFGRSGRIYCRKDTLASCADQPRSYEVLSQDFQTEELAADLMLVTYRSAQVDADGSISRHTLRTSLWQRTEVRWQLRFHQGTPTEAFEITVDARS